MEVGHAERRTPGSRAVAAARAEIVPPRRIGALAAVAVGVFVLDAVSKVIVVRTLSGRPPVVLVPHVLDLELVRNPGAAFGIAAGATVLFTVIAVAVIVAILRVASRLRSLPWAVVLGLLLGGATGNLLDRLVRWPGPLRGRVVDWIHLHHWPVFNLADSAIVLGGVLAVILSSRAIPLDGRPHAHPHPADGEQPTARSDETRPEPPRPDVPGDGT